MATPSSTYEVISVAMTPAAFFGITSGNIKHHFPWTEVTSLEYTASELSLSIATKNGITRFQGGSIGNSPMAYFGQRLAAAGYLQLVTPSDAKHGPPTTTVYMPIKENIDETEIILRKPATETAVTFTFSQTALRGTNHKGELVEFYPWAVLKTIKVNHTKKELILTNNGDKKERYISVWSHMLERFQEALKQVPFVKKDRFYGLLKKKAKYTVTYDYDNLSEDEKAAVQFQMEAKNSTPPQILSQTISQLPGFSRPPAPQPPKRTSSLPFLTRAVEKNLVSSEFRPSFQEMVFNSQSQLIPAVVPEAGAYDNEAFDNQAEQ